MSSRVIPHPDIGPALRRLRRLSGKPIKQIEGLLGVTQQAISRWETAQVNFPPEKVKPYLDAIGATDADLERMLVGVSEPPSLPASPTLVSNGLEAIEVTDESMSPWCEPGEWVVFQRARHPKRMEGCVVEFRSGKRLVRLFGRERDGQVFVQRVNPEATEEFSQSDIVGIYRIASRGDNYASTS